MASFRKIAGNRWRAEVARRGVRKSRVFDSKQAARDWAAREEYLILNAPEVASRVLFREVLARYAREVSPAKRGARWEVLRLERIQKDRIADLATADHLAVGRAAGFAFLPGIFPH
jgi:hypothetical protein